MSTRLLPLLLLLIVQACGPGYARDPELAEWIRNDPRRCLIPRDLSERLETQARRCAERFIAENGYTEAAEAIDTARLVPEVGRRVTPATMERRYGTLLPDALMTQCSGGQCHVFFEARGQGGQCLLRAVTMTWVFTRMHVRPGLIADRRCGRQVSLTTLTPEVPA